MDKTYDTRGRLNKESLPFKGTTAQHWKTYYFDSYDRLRGIVYASGKRDTWSYSGNSVTTNSEGISTTRTYNEKGQLITVTDRGGTITYNYRPDGQVSSINTNGVATSFTYDGYGRRTSIDDPSAGFETIAYDAAGNIVRQTDATGSTITLGYDSYNRLITKTYPEFSTTYVYSAKNELLSETSTNATSRIFTYDGFGRIKTEQENVPDGKWLKKTYSYKDGNIKKLDYQSNSGIITSEEFIYKNGHVASMNRAYFPLDSTPSDPKKPIINSGINSFGWTNPIGPRPELTTVGPTFWQLKAENEMGMPVEVITEKITRTYEYDSFGFPTSRRATVSGNEIFHHAYSFSRTTGNLSYRDDYINDTMEDFGYDNLSRLTYIQETETNIRYRANGNIEHTSLNGTYEYNRTDKPYALTDIAADNSRQLSQHGANQNSTYTSFKRPAAITSGSSTVSFTYNASGGRVKALHSTSGTTYTKYYIGDRYETDSNNNEILYIGGDAYTAPALCKKEGNGNWNIYYICRDYLGSICYITNAAGEKVQELSYDAWGRLRNPATHGVYAPGEEPDLFLGRGYTGHEHLKEHGLIHMNARLYDPVVGRFLSPDPYVQNPENTQNYNRYSYALNNPLKYTDPSGESYYYNDWTKRYYNKDGIIVEWQEVYEWLNRTGQFANPNNWNSNSTTGWDIGGGYYNPGYIYFNNTTGQIRFLIGSKTESGTTLRTINMTGNIYGMGNTWDGTVGGLDFANMTMGAIGLEVGALEVVWDYSSKSSQNNTLRTLQRALKDHGKNVKTNAIRTGISGTFKVVGRATGVASAGLSWYEFAQNPTTGGLIKSVVSTGLLFVRVNPLVGIGLAVLDLSGGSDWVYNQAGNFIDNKFR